MILTRRREMPSRLTRDSQQAASAAARRNEQALVILAWVVGATGVRTIPNTYESTDAGTQTLRLWYGTAEAAQATVQQITLITLTSTVSAGYYSNEYEAAVVEHHGWQPQRTMLLAKFVQELYPLEEPRKKLQTTRSVEGAPRRGLHIVG